MASSSATLNSKAKWRSCCLCHGGTGKHEVSNQSHSRDCKIQFKRKSIVLRKKPPSQIKTIYFKRKFPLPDLNLAPLRLRSLRHLSGLRRRPSVQRHLVPRRPRVTLSLRYALIAPSIPEHHRGSRRRWLFGITSRIR